MYCGGEPEVSLKQQYNTGGSESQQAYEMISQAPTNYM